MKRLIFVLAFVLAGGGCTGYVEGTGSDLDGATSGLATEVLSDDGNLFEARLLDENRSPVAELTWDRLTARGEVRTASDQPFVITAGEAEVLPEDLLQGMIEVYMASISPVETFDGEESEALGDEVASVSASLSRPVGHFDRVTPQYAPLGQITRRAQGWSYDPDRPAASNWVHFSVKPVLASAHQYAGATFANAPRPDVNRVMGVAGNHGFNWVIPEYWDADSVGNQHPKMCKVIYYTGSIAYWCLGEIRAYGLDLTGQQPRALGVHSYVSSSWIQ